MTPFADRLVDAVQACGSPACVGLDPHLDRLPHPLVAPTADLVGPDRRVALAEAAHTFCLGVLNALVGVVPAVKPQVAFFEALGAPGVRALEQVVAHARDRGLLVVLDAKRGDIGSTARAYVRATLADDGPLGADAVTLSPYLGAESLDPFVDAAVAGGKGLFLLVRTSNQGAGQWQLGGEDPIAERVARWIAATNARHPGRHGYGPVGAVVGATLPREAPHWRAALPASWFLVPGYGAQGASAEDCRAHAHEDGLGALVVSARGVLYPPTGRAGTDWRDGVADRARAFARDLARLMPGAA